jgi:twitching motility protein PilT
MDINKLLELAVKHNASDLHFSQGLSPLLRIDGEPTFLTDIPAQSIVVLDLLRTVMTEQQWQNFQQTLESDLSYTLPGGTARFRVNAYYQERGAAAVFRVIPSHVPTLEELALPQTLQNIAKLPHGLVLVTGPTGSGKSTTLAAIIDSINQNRAEHILTIEDPIEFIHQSKKSLINQREAFRHTLSFQNALRASLREDPDVILVGEMRDLETIRLALTAAETGHLVFATLHTSSAAKTINRIIDVFPSAEKSMVGTMLSESLQAVISQTLLKKKGGGRVAALEIMICTSAIRNLIREDKVAQIYSCIQTGAATGMQTLDQHLKILVANQTISRETALEVALSKELLK